VVFGAVSIARILAIDSAQPGAVLHDCHTGLAGRIKARVATDIEARLTIARGGWAGQCARTQILHRPTATLRKSWDAFTLAGGDRRRGHILLVVSGVRVVAGGEFSCADPASTFARPTGGTTGKRCG